MIIDTSYGSPQVRRGPFLDRLVRIDWVLISATLAVVLIGISMVHSTEMGVGSGLVLRQSLAALFGIIGMIFLTLLPYQVFRSYVRPIYGVMILLLLGVLIFGVNLRGTKGWFHFGPIYVQASEMAKILFVLTMAGYLDRRIQWYTPQALFIPFIIALIPIGMILLQPDLSSSLVFFPTTLLMFYFSGARTLHLLAVCLVGGLATGIPLISTYFDLIEGSLSNKPVILYFANALKGGWAGLGLFLGVGLSLSLIWWFLRRMRVYIPTTYLWITMFLIGLGILGAVASQHALKDYQRKRLVAFINPNIDPLGSGYNVRQSQIAIGSGRVIGKGYGKGSQSRLGFLPSRHTDFIFSVVGEELGFARAVLILALYFLIIWRGFEIALVSRDRFGSIVAAGFSSMFAFYFLLNLGMTMGMAPVAGVPLPLVSYGGSSMVSSLLAIGLLISIQMRRYLL
ncbi:rod shape-determining protein RodA [bacterium F11]|nr:rod shape-determining protein RodA [bacterium F11]